MGDVIRLGIRFMAAITAAGILIPVAQEFGLIDSFFALSEGQQAGALTAVITLFAYRFVYGLTRRPSYASVPAAIAGAAPAPLAVMAHRGAAAATRTDESTQEESETLNEQNKRIRYHESGHAAVALHLGFSIGLVSTIAQGNSGGRVNIRSHPAGNRANAALWDKAIMALAGSAAESKFLNEANASGLTMDMEEVQLICSALSSAKFKVGGKAWTTPELVMKAQDLADQYVEDCAAHIEAMAEHLIEHPEISGTKAAELFDSVELGQQAA